MTTRTLPRGGVIVETAAGPIQFGSPPETIKDTMSQPGGVPRVIVVTAHLFDVDRGLSAAELEFPIYFHFFVRHQRLAVVCESWQRRSIEALVGEALFPPRPASPLADEFPGGPADPRLPDLAAEAAFFQRHPAQPDRPFVFEDVVEFHEFGAEGRVEVGGVEIAIDRAADEFVVVEGGVERARVARDLRLPTPVSRKLRADVFVPPVFGVTALGTGSGFDAASSTSGFVYWINGRGVLVDPPVDATIYLDEQRIPPKLVPDVILTHVHADHDAGILQKILEQGIVRLHTTPTVMEAFLRKASIMTGLSTDEVGRMIEFHPVPIGVPVPILGARFTFKYTVHSIPTLQFTVERDGRRIAYSGDTINVRAVLDEMLAAGVLSPGRHADVLDFPWQADVIIHEAGMAPLHTPAEVLDQLPPEVKTRLRLVHTAEDKVSRFPDLRMMDSGVEATLVVEAEESPLCNFYRKAQALASVEFLRTMPPERVADLLLVARERTIEPGEYLIREGQVGDEVYVLLGGEVTVIRGGREYKGYRAGDFVGDMAVVSEAPRFADVVADSRVEALAIGKQDFLSLLGNTTVIDYLRRLAEIRRQDSWPLLEESPVLDFLNATQLTRIQALLVPAAFEAGQTVDGAVHLIVSGEAEVDRTWRFGRGHVVGPVLGGPTEHSVRAVSELSTYRLDRRLLEEFLADNPGVRLRLTHRCQYTEQARIQRPG